MNISINHSDCVLRVGVYPSTQRCALWLIDAKTHQMFCHVTLDQSEADMAEDEIIVRSGAEHQQVLETLLLNRLVCMAGRSYKRGIVAGEHCFLSPVLYQKYQICRFNQNGSREVEVEAL